MKAIAPSQLEMLLYAPGMSLMHRAGLGGLACTLKYIERAWEQGALTDDDVPGGPWCEGSPPWTIDSQRVVLDFGRATNAREYLRRLFVIAFDIRDGLIYLPGQYGDVPPSFAVRAALQSGMLTTFFAQSKSRTLEPSLITHEADVSGDGASRIRVSFKRCLFYRHQEGWELLSNARTLELSQKPVIVKGFVNPGAIVRHDKCKQSTIVDRPNRLLPLYFSIVGCLSLPIRGGNGILMCPDVDSLERFTIDRPALTPSSTRECQVESAGDAALQAQLHLRSRGFIEAQDVPSCHVTTFRKLDWAAQQKTRASALVAQSRQSASSRLSNRKDIDQTLDLFERVLGVLPPRVRSSRRTQQVGNGRNRREIEQVTCFWARSYIRPLIADNIALKRKWYAGFASLMVARDADKSPIRDRLVFESKGLTAMTKDSVFLEPAEQALVEAIHISMKYNFKRIYEELAGGVSSKAAIRKRQTRFRERIRLQLVGAKTMEQCRTALSKLFSEPVYGNESLVKNWQIVIPLFRTQWRLLRDLALIALASYPRQENDETKEQES